MLRDRGGGIGGLGYLLRCGGGVGGGALFVRV